MTFRLFFFKQDSINFFFEKENGDEGFLIPPSLIIPYPPSLITPHPAFSHYSLSRLLLLFLIPPSLITPHPAFSYYSLSRLLRASRDEFSLLNDCLELLRHRLFRELAAVFVGKENVHLGALRRHDLAVQRVLAEVDLRAVRLLDGYRGEGVDHLRLAALAVDDFQRRDERVEHHSSLFAGVEDDGVDLLLHLDDRVLALVDVDRVLH